MTSYDCDLQVCDRLLKINTYVVHIPLTLKKYGFFKLDVQEAICKEKNQTKFILPTRNY